MILLFWISLIFIGAILAMMVFSIVAPERRIWPPKKKHSWQYFMVWGSTVVAFSCGIILGLLDWNGLGWSLWVRYAVGLPLVVIGNVVVWRAVVQLGFEETTGIKGTLNTGGFYRYSRNPQYVSDIVMLIGWAVLSASGMTAICVALGILVYILMPFAEEPWLKQAYGERYVEYAKRTPRFLLRRRNSIN